MQRILSCLILLAGLLGTAGLARAQEKSAPPAPAMQAGAPAGVENPVSLEKLFAPISQSAPGGICHAVVNCPNGGTVSCYGNPDWEPCGYLFNQNSSQACGVVCGGVTYECSPDCVY